MMSRAALDRQFTRLLKRADRLNEQDRARLGDLVRAFKAGHTLDSHEERVLHGLAQAAGA